MAAPQDADMPAPRGHVVTFYSFKGGTGRTMALANSACVLAEAARGAPDAVLVVDWDLEAPGLHRYFPPRLRSPNTSANLGLDDQPGLIDLVTLLMQALPEGEPESEEAARQAARDALDAVPLERFIASTDVPGVSILRAGRDEDNGYSKRVNTFNWEALFRRCPLIYGELAECLAARFGWTLIDSRTGLTDISGICTALMPEKLVVVFTPNRQSLSGVRDIVQRALAYRLDGGDMRPLLVYPLASRIEASMERLSRDWRRGRPDVNLVGYQPMFEQLLAECNGLPQCSLEAYFDAVFIQQTPDWAYGEVIAVREGSGDRLSLSQSYRVFVERLMSGQPPWALEEAQPAAAQRPATAAAALPPQTAADADPVADLLGEVVAQARPEPLPLPAQPTSPADGIRVFACFALADIGRVQPALDVLRAQGMSVNSEGDLAAGQSYTQVVTRLVDDADVVIVFWSQSSVQLQSVETQAIEGLRRGVLLPVLLDDALPPLAFRSVQAVDLRRRDDASRALLAQAVHRLASVRPGDAVPQPTRSAASWELPRAATPPSLAPAPWGRRLPPLVALGSLIAIVVTALAFWLGNKSGGSATQPMPPDLPASVPTAQVTFVTVPDLVNLDTDAATTTAKALGLNLSLVDARAASGVQQTSLYGIVTTQEPAAKSLAPAGSTLKLTVTTNTVTVPQLAGHTIDEAFNTLRNAGLLLGKTEAVEGTKLKSGTIISQDPTAGSRVAGGVRINVRVAANARREPVSPDFNAPAIPSGAWEEIDRQNELASEAPVSRRHRGSEGKVLSSDEVLKFARSIQKSAQGLLVEIDAAERQQDVSSAGSLRARAAQLQSDLLDLHGRRPAMETVSQARRWQPAFSAMEGAQREVSKAGEATKRLGTLATQTKR
jgi:PASTA domain/TIR domain